jgi:hyperosmotically inducible periplasmic protein
MRKIIRNIIGDTGSMILSLVLILGLAGGVAAATNSEAKTAITPAQRQELLTEQVRHKLAMIPYYSVFDILQFKVEGDTVTLMGQVRRPVIKDEAESSVKHVEGVKTVRNQIEVLPPSPNDDRIRRAAYRSIYSFGPLQPYALGVNPGIHIIVKNGDVTLEGSVTSKGDWNAANVRARTVPGVFSVTNNLRVEKSS